MSWRRAGSWPLVLSCVLALIVPFLQIQPVAAYPPPFIPTTAVFPWVPNGEQYGGMGPWYSALTLHNYSASPVYVEMYAAGTAEPLAAARLEPTAMMSWASQQLFGDNPGRGVTVGAWKVAQTRVQRSAGASDMPSDIPCNDPGIIEVKSEQQVFSRDRDYRITSDSRIEWLPGGQRPAPETWYSVEFACEPWYGHLPGILTLAAPNPLSGPLTSTAQQTLSELPAQRFLALGFFPLVQTNNGWTTVLHITNFRTPEEGSCTITVILTGQDDPQRRQRWSSTIEPGQTLHLDVQELVGTEWIGWAALQTDDECTDKLAAFADRLKARHPWGSPANLAITNEPSGGQWSPWIPLVYQGHYQWNSGITVTNVDDFPKNFSVTFYTREGQVARSESHLLPPYGMAILYYPATDDIGLGGLGSARISSNGGIIVAADAVRYGDQQQAFGWVIGNMTGNGFALVKKGASTAEEQTGLAILNTTDEPRPVAVSFRDSDGKPVPPTAEEPLVETIAPKSLWILHTPTLADLPSGFAGSASIIPLDASGGEGIIAVANRVHYGLRGDGAGSVPILLEFARGQTCAVETLAPLPGDAAADFRVRCPLPTLAGLPVIASVGQALASQNGDRLSFTPPGQPLTETLAFRIDPVRPFDLYWVDDLDHDGSVTLQVLFYWDHNRNGQLDNGDVLTQIGAYSSYIFNPPLMLPANRNSVRRTGERIALSLQLSLDNPNWTNFLAVRPIVTGPNSGTDVECSPIDREGRIECAYTGRQPGVDTLTFGLDLYRDDTVDRLSGWVTHILWLPSDTPPSLTCTVAPDPRPGDTTPDAIVTASLGIPHLPVSFVLPLQASVSNPPTAAFVPTRPESAYQLQSWTAITDAAGSVQVPLYWVAEPAQWTGPAEANLEVWLHWDVGGDGNVDWEVQIATTICHWTKR
ncbi:MAG: hypothetical protein RMJ05_11265 [Thermomicrobium sp.]|nr:DUF4815 domain-containing protein [Thermomicrobium sp.]MDW8007278.1 hypothetical protein [Thermomicrobium sp.]